MGVDLDIGIYVSDTGFIPTIAQLRGIADILKELSIIDDANHERLYNEFDDMEADEEGRPRFDDRHPYIEIVYDTYEGIPGIEGSPVRMVIDPEAGLNPDMIPAFAIMKVDQEGWNEESIERIDRDLHRGLSLTKLEIRLNRLLKKGIIARQSDGCDLSASSIVDEGATRIDIIKNADETTKRLLKFFHAHPDEWYPLAAIGDALGVEANALQGPIELLSDADVFEKSTKHGYCLTKTTEYVCPWCGHIQFQGQQCDECGEPVPRWKDLQKPETPASPRAVAKTYCEPIKVQHLIEITYNSAPFAWVDDDSEVFLDKRTRGKVHSLPDLSMFDGLEQLRDLRRLVFNHRDVTSIKFPCPLPNLEVLVLQGNKIKRIENLDRLVNLRKLDLSENPISLIEGLDNLVNLSELVISSSLIERIEGLDNLVNLKRLTIHSRKIERIEGLDNLVNLEYLDLSYSNILRIESLDNLVNLKELHLEANRISRIEDLESLVNLEQLHFGYSGISTIEGLGTLKKLKIFTFHGWWPNFPASLVQELGGYKRGSLDKNEWRMQNPRAFVEYCEKKRAN